ncbi:uncharacterized protein HMPREF1541_08562 [Cyphellophora europaea CBS 101466]|uniref:Uncharacterized protein n=1 Tax=Cyphellophora europaea (strain CBS 101466) TaxID=1220924 RepID=W2RIW6_CYPE1|nr:uncharacterized protein HMPREF1541_08562 [Cyphellophora europaea CBS 101466]ETN36285.1 hypothetical protein HMPREF1541_08562 [Cyphellophora europaea CBS 101466]
MKARLQRSDSKISPENFVQEATKDANQRYLAVLAAGSPRLSALCSPARKVWPYLSSSQVW